MTQVLKRNIPNLFTCCNLISGCIATYFAFGADYKAAFIWIIIGAVFDFFDGMVARLLHVSSPIGKELDSLADVITFGVAPATFVFTELHVMDYPAQAEFLRAYLPFSAYIMAAFSALRLAKFNLDERQTTSFIGLPTPANALYWASFIVCMRDMIEASPLHLFVVVAMMLISCWLMNCEIAMFALKFKNYGWSDNKLKYGFVLLSIAVFAFLGIFNGFWIVIALYIIISCLQDLLFSKS